MFDEATNYVFRIKSLSAGVILLFIEKYVNGAILAHERIKENKAKVVATKWPGSFKLPLETIFLDVHLYLICWDKVYKLLIKLIEVVGNSSLESLLNKYNTVFIKYSDARHHLEHIDERLVGKKRGGTSQSKFKNDLGNLSGDYYTFWGEKYDVSDKSIKQLRDFYGELIDRVKRL